MKSSRNSAVKTYAVVIPWSLNSSLAPRVPTEIQHSSQISNEQLVF
jgi:hypothetical protein